ncbi:unnamed protein product [Mytilus edulis]|uniref:Uncharacterized protein n=1 Tax=Mytilus edulis TaxID=6550 RepID=A0A8S3SFD2_MYTED|nr:unnamed protein product [Mytilus edulis]
MKNLKEKQLLLEKHDRKYNALVYGMPEKSDENIWKVIDDLMINYLKMEKPKAESFPFANAHRIPARQNSGEKKLPNQIISRFIHYADKELFLSHGSHLAGKNIRIVDDLPPCMKDARNELAKIAYKIRSDDNLKNTHSSLRVTVVLETRTTSGIFASKQFRCCIELSYTPSHTDITIDNIN